MQLSSANAMLPVVVMVSYGRRAGGGIADSSKATGAAAAAAAFRHFPEYDCVKTEGALMLNV